MKRRQFLAALGSAAAAWPHVALAQESKRARRIGVLWPFDKSDVQALAGITALQQAMQALGWTEGGTAEFQIRWSGDDLRKVSSYAKELVAWQPDVILGRSTPVTAALLQETRTIPIVFVNVGDPVGAGFAATVARPGRNVTGFTNVKSSLGGKWVEILKEMDAKIVQIAVLFNPKTSFDGGLFYLRLIQNAARSIGVETIATPIENAAAIEQAFDTLKGLPNLGLIVPPDITTTGNRAHIIALAAKHRLPAVYAYSFITTEGGLASYGMDDIDGYKRAATYIDRILRGEKPGELAVQAPVKFELAINHKTAKALGLQLSPMLLGRADEVIE